MRIISKPIIPSARALMSAAAISLIVISTATPVAAQVGGLFPWEWKWPGDSQSTSQTRHLTTFPRTARPGQIIVSFADRKLYYVHRSGEAITYPIAIPRPEDRWQGVLKVSSKKVNPPWTPTPSMRRENPSLPAHVPGGHPQNPLGSHALYLGSSLYRIHGTDAPWTIGQPVSKGCVRMHNADVADLFARVPVGTKVTVTWQSFYSS
jgi:lipoprotein-anchoring transpeptidase ErfK/SrfK